MLQNDLYQLLAKTGLDVYFYQTEEPVSPPYVVYLRDGTASWGSDDRNFIRKDSYIVEFYSVKQDAENQGKIETLLDSAGINYTTVESYLQDEGLYMVAFYFDIVRKV
ncbi:hypothetical protein [Anaerotignum sp. MB30-C6]|uniref:hypothetical protein n=1 Tax=Anaerotignum sp. MB30-C6 TaxID=3070814 RepID=UPI0027DCA138|nr:hypothetical protein [Anaerotignum sp. MB30-C6]WMI82095.1 hypothetical protein RBQ60_05000 [Anaerotignum sp. MB30-C6]